MLKESEIKEIISHLEKAQNPVFFFDNDVDGLASFLILRRFIDRGKGVAIKSFPDLNANYARKIHELKADYVFVLDKPKIAEGFLKETFQFNVPVVWIDHHDVSEDSSIDTANNTNNNMNTVGKSYEELEKEYENLHIYNTTRNDKENSEPVSYWAHKITGKKQDLWISMVGCIGDGFLPEFAEDFAKQYNDLLNDKVKTIKTAFQIFYETEFGKIIKILSFALKDRTSNVVKTLKFLGEAKSPYEIIEESKKTHHIIKRFEQINKKYLKLLEKAQEIAASRYTGKLLYFQYGGDLSLSADIANELIYKFPEKVVVVAYIKGANANVSIRGSIDVRKLTLEAITGIENATGGGHKNACGAKILVEDLPKFRENLAKMVK